MEGAWWEPAERALLVAVDLALAEAARRGGSNLACRPGCMECCVGPFAVNRLDAWRLRRGLELLGREEPQRAAALVGRARSVWSELRADFPGDAGSGRLGDDEEAEQAFLERHARLPCPALDPATELCDLYSHRPLACRIFGPPARMAGRELPPCRLCFRDVPGDEVERCRVEPDPAGLEKSLLDRLEAERGPGWETVIAFVLA